jgi:hypothetical protein
MTGRYDFEDSDYIAINFLKLANECRRLLEDFSFFMPLIGSFQEEIAFSE